MPRIAITDYIDSPDIEKEVLGDLVSMEVTDDTEVLLVWHTVIDKEFMDNYPNLKGIVRYGVGFDNININYAFSKEIYVCNTPDYGTDEVSDTAISFIINFVRKTTYYNELSKKLFHSWQENTVKKIKRNSEIKIGIIGAGRIGGSVILKCNALKFQTYFFDPYQPRGYEKLLSTNRTETLYELLEKCDVITVHVPLTDETNGMIDHNFISKMKKGSILINTARGKVLKDIDVLYQPLKSKHLDSVGLDVLPEEPPLKGKLIDEWRNNSAWLNGRLLINPHTAYYSKQAYREMRSKASLNAKRIIDGLIPFNIIS